MPAATSLTPILLSPPDVGPAERAALLRAFDSGWLAPLGPEVDAFEAEVAAATGRRHAVALSSGTAALHLALLDLGVGPGDEVVAPTFTFAASVNPIRYCGATPLLVDAEPDTWGLDPALLADLLDERARAGRLPRAIVAVDLYGNVCDHRRLTDVAARYDIPIVEDAAEALGATAADGRPAGSLGAAALVSFNGNKIITTSGGGMLVTDDDLVAERARNRASQARLPVAHYEHVEIGYNYRLSNLLAAVGRAQLAGLDAKVARRRAIGERYRAALGDLPGVSFGPHDRIGRGNGWLSVVLLDPATGTTPERLRLALQRAGIEARPVWKPMHRQPVHAFCAAVLNGTSDDAFARGLCLPSGSSLTDAQVERVVDAIRDHLDDRAGSGR
ncbi:aminotransferase class I/II-fold pyridoxal phosphate-dependent enzyme [Nocardioides ginsengisoli]|uniref:DegT/DnrJ/EryC1/StrS family aminotransferase n=1 Tax=Nocardioides ginsengisoli TaxID=363868 RepID=A0ABW3VVL9_9ACTN